MKVRRRPGRRAPRARPLFSLLLALLVVGSAAPFAPAARAARQDGTAAPRASKAAAAAEFVPGEALVRFRSEWEADAAAASPTEVEVGREAGEAGPGRIISPELAGDGAGRVVTARFKRFDGSDIVPGLRLADLSTADRAHTLSTIAALNSRPDVLYAEPNYIWHAKAVPNDPRFAEQYAMQTISAPAAWDTTTGSKSVVVAVIDTGVNLQHPDLVDNAWVNPGEVAGNGVDDDGNGFTDDVNGWDFSTCPDNDSFTSPAVCGDNTVFDSATNDFHGTHVAGIIGARGNNSAGVTGVNWQVSIMSLKVLNPSGETAHIIRAYNYVRMMRQRGVNVRVTNNSYGGPGFSQAALDAINALNASGILFVAAAGNESRDNFSIEEFPSNYNAPNVIAVASTNQSDSLSGFSNFSSRLVSMGAPGTGILSTTPNNGYQLLQGTSMATPHVAGAAALVCSAVAACRDSANVNSGISVANLRGALAFTGDRLGTLENNTTTGRRLNVRKALDAALGGDTTAPAQTALSAQSQSGRGLTLSFNAPGDDGFAGTAADYDFFFVNPALGVRVLMPTGVAPTAGGAQQSVTVDTPYRNLSGTVELVAYDERGNASTSSVAVSVQQNPSTDPYVVTQSAAEALSTGGTRLAIDGDDKYLANHALPFQFPFYGQQHGSLTVSSNGVLYFSTPPQRDNGDAGDVPSSVAATQGQALIAGLWDDLEIDTARRADAGVFVVQPDASRVIFRWQATTFFESHGINRGINAVNFEIELRSGGAIIFRYGGGNQNLFPVVAVSGGEPSAYDVASHTSEAALKSLANAQTVTLAPRTNSGPPPAAVQFNTASFAQSEAAGQALLTVTRSGDLQAAGTVTVRTVDNPAAVRCDDTTTLPGVAFARCDYATTVETLSFAANETSKTIAVPLVNDAHVEPAETVQVVLSQPTGGLVLGAQTTMTLTLVSDDAAGAANPIDGPPHEFFVRQHYLDFLSREPEASGLQAWLNVLNNCPNVYNHDAANASAECDRNTVSSAFFRSFEFYLKGGYVFRFYRAGLGRLPLYAEMIPDMRTVTGQTPEEVFAKKAAFAEEFVRTRQELQTAQGPAGNALFVNMLLDRYGLQSITTPDPAAPDGTTKVTLARADLVARLDAGTLTRGQVLRAIADSDQVDAAERDRSFVAMQYFGYLRRDPDEGGFNSWMAYLATHPGDYYTMVNGFLYSGEYRLRFGRE